MAVCAVAGPAAAQPAAASVASAASDIAAEAADIGEVIVTARRSEERAQDVPIPLSVLGGEALERSGAYTVADIQNQVPSLVAFNSNPRNSSIGIRGIGVSSAADGLDSSVGIYMDGVYLGRPGMALADLIDIERVEVLRGPQGTLFGRNSSAGVLNVITRAPTFDPGGSVEVSLGDYRYNQVRVSVNGPIVDGLVAGRLTAFQTHRSGVLNNPATGVRGNSIGRAGARGQLLFTPAANLSVRLIAEYSEEDDTCCVSVLKQVFTPAAGATTARTLAAFAALGYTPRASLSESSNNAPQNMRTDQSAASAEVSWDLGWAQLTSISAWRYWHFDPLQDSDGTPLDIIQVNVAQTRDWQWSQEFRLAGETDRLNWQGGVYLFRQKLKDHYILNQFGFDASAFYTTYARLSNPNAAAVTIAPGSQYIGDTRAVSDSAAAFGQGDFALTPHLTLTGGLRYTHDKRTGTTVTSTRGTPYGPTSIPFNYDLEVKGGNWSYLVGAKYDFTDNAMGYVSYSTGYKSAGLNLNSSVSPGTPLVLEPEEVEAFEVGVKQALFAGRVILNLNAFHSDLSGLQANVYPLNGAKSYLTNVGDIRARGVEYEVAWRPNRQWEFTTNGSYNDVEYSSYTNAPCPIGKAAPCELTGEPVYQAPKWVANATVRYETELANGWRPYGLVQFTYRSGVFGTVDNADYARIPGYSLVNARVGARISERYEAAVWVNNLFDETYFQNMGTRSIPGAGPFGVGGQLGTPRTVGATLRAEF